MTEVGEVGEGVVEVEGGYCHTLVRKGDGVVYSMGCGDDGQRGDGMGEEDEEEGGGGPRAVTTRVPLPTPAAAVAAGANHSVVLGTDGRVYTFGANDVGQCGVVPTGAATADDDDEDDESGRPILSPTPVQLPPDAGKVSQVSAGYAHTVLTTESGRVFVFGQNDNGQLGVDAGVQEFMAGKDPEAQTRPVEARVPDNL